MKTHEIGKKIKNNKEIKYDKRTIYDKEIKYDKRTIYNKNGFPVVSAAVLALIISGCLFADLITTREPGYMDLANYTKAPGTEFYSEPTLWGGIYFPVYGMAEECLYR